MEASDGWDLRDAPQGPTPPLPDRLQAGQQSPSRLDPRHAGQGVKAPITVAVHGEAWLTELLNLGNAPLTINIYRYHLRYFSDFVHSIGERLEDVTEGTAQQYLSEMVQRGNKAKTRRIRIGTPKYWYKWLFKKGYMPWNPLADLKSVKAQERMPRPLSLTAIEKLVAAAYTFEGFRSIYPKRDVAFLWTAYEAGARRAEVLDLNMGDVDLENWSLILMGKGSVEELQPITERAVRALREWMTQREELIAHWGRPHERAVFCTWKGRMKRSAVQQMFDRLAKAAGIPHCHPHQLRHSLGTHALEAGMDFRYVQELLRHKSSRSTERYTHVAKERLRFEYMKAMGNRKPTPPPQ